MVPCNCFLFSKSKIVWFLQSEASIFVFKLHRDAAYDPPPQTRFAPSYKKDNLPLCAEKFLKIASNISQYGSPLFSEEEVDKISLFA